MEPDRTSASPASLHVCPSCGGEVAPNLLSCPSCHRLVHADRLKELAEAAESSERAGEVSAALGAWREAITLLPPASRQYSVLAGRIAALSRQVEAGPVRKAPEATRPADPESLPVNPHDRSRWSGGVISGAIGTVALFLFKFKFLALLIPKAKFLLLGLTKASTFFSMLAAFGVYWTVFGGWFALGLVLSIYVHEMGHVAALVRYGVPASAPLFIPGVGAVIRLRQSFFDPREDARVGLAGPIWGCAAALVCAATYLVTDEPLWGALARVGAWINLFNLTPIWQLDGSRAFHSLTRPQRWLAVTAVAFAWTFTADGLLVLVMAVGAFRAAAGQAGRRARFRGAGPVHRPGRRALGTAPAAGPTSGPLTRPIRPQAVGTSGIRRRQPLDNGVGCGILRFSSPGQSASARRAGARGLARTRRTREPSARPGKGNETTDLCPRSTSLSASRAGRSSTRPSRRCSRPARSSGACASRSRR